MSVYVYDDYLSHHGVLGMRWGIRRYQPYPDGHKGGKEVGEAAKNRRERKVIKKEADKVAESERSKEMTVGNKIKSVLKSDAFKNTIKKASKIAVLSAGGAFLAQLGYLRLDEYLSSASRVTNDVTVSFPHGGYEPYHYSF